MNKVTRGRLALIGIVFFFAIPVIAAFYLRASGWQPSRTTQSGILVEPQRDVSAAPVVLVDGSRYPWRDANFRWTLVLLTGSECGPHCRERLDEVLRMRITLGRNIDRLRVLYLGAPLPADFLAARTSLRIGHDDTDAFALARPKGEDELTLALVDPRGQWMLRYADGYSAQGLRRDITKILY
jgi:hypothetical protein